MKTKTVDTRMHLERIALKDKKSQFREPRPTQYILQVVLQRPEGGNQVVIKEWVSQDKSMINAIYKDIRSSLMD